MLPPTDKEIRRLVDADLKVFFETVACREEERMQRELFAN